MDQEPEKEVLTLHRQVVVEVSLAKEPVLQDLCIVVVYF